jgi:hypothetical protein
MVNQTIVLELDELDYDAIQEAVAKRQALGRYFPGYEARIMPDGERNRAGAALAEICRSFTQTLKNCAKATPVTELQRQIVRLKPRDRRKLLSWLQELTQPDE